MPRLKVYLTILTIMFGILVIVIANMPTTAPVPANTPRTTSPSLSIEPPSPTPATVRSETGAGTVASTTPEKTAVIPKKMGTPQPAPAPVTSAPVSVPVPTPSPTPSVTNAALDAAAAALRAALVNIICYVPAGSGLHSISGSGIFIDPKGIILTNAHIAQYFLLADRDVSCDIRTGSPATNSYEASILYISPAWLRANSTVLTQASPSGTGEYDFALLAITKTVSNDPLPLTFPSISLATTPSFAGTPVVIASYGAQFLDAMQIQSALFPTVVFGSVKDVFTFATNTIDVLALGGSVAAQEGSSGGGVAGGSGELIGTITTSTISGSTSTRSLSAITASYIRTEYANETGSTLESLLAKPASTALADFASQKSSLESLLTLP